MKFVALCALLAIAVHSANGLAQLRTVRRVEAVAPVPAAAAEAPKVEMVLAEIKSEADETTEDGSNDASALEEAVDQATAELPAAESEHAVHFSRFTKPMELLPNDHTTLVEVAANEDEGGADKGSNPTYILPVDPFNYFPFFNGFSNVNPFSQFYPPPPYLYPQYTNYMHQYANHGAGHPPGYPYPGAYGGLGAAYGHGGGMGGHGHAGFPYNYPAAHPHMHYPFGAYKMDVSGPDVRTGSNNPPPFPQFMELAAQGKLITPEIIPKSAEAAADAEEDGDSEGDVVIASLIETAVDVDAEDSDEDEAENLEYESEESEDSDEAAGLEYEAEESEGSDEASDVEILDEEAPSFSDAHVEYQAEAAEGSDEAEVEYEF